MAASGRWARRPEDRERSAGTAASPPRPTEEVARDICLGALAVRPRTRAELATILRRQGVADRVAREVLDRYDDVGLIDDRAFARAWVTSRHRGRGLARRALAGELRRKGVDAHTVGEALGELDPHTEEETARALVARRLRVERSAAPAAAAAPAALFRRLVGALARKGYPPDLAIRVVKEALAARAETAPFAEDIDVDGLADGIEPQ
jgi:regulatory protein